MKKHFLKLSFLATILGLFIFSAGFSLAQTCSDPTDPTSETGQCRSSCDSATEHQISGTCMGQVCCAAGGSGAPTTPAAAPTSTTAPAPATAPATAPAALPTTAPQTAASGGWSLGSIAGFGLPSGTIWGIISNIMFWLLGILGIIGIIGFIISGILYLTSTGDDDAMARAKRALQWSIVGVVVGLIGVVIIQAIDYALNAMSWF